MKSKQLIYIITVITFLISSELSSPDSNNPFFNIDENEMCLFMAKNKERKLV